MSSFLNKEWNTKIVMTSYKTYQNQQKYLNHSFALPLLIIILNFKAAG